jgi:uncharacterized heparinase superfamily protein
LLQIRLAVSAKAPRVLRKGPRAVIQRIVGEARTELDRLRAPRRAARFGERELLTATGATDLADLWQRLAERPFVAQWRPVDLTHYEELCPGDQERILTSAEAALQRKVDLLGSGPVELGTPIEWRRDFKTGISWPASYARRLDYVNLDRPSDAKVPWELSRLQWLLPAGQAYLLTGEERYAEAARALLEEWIAANPYALGVNWAVTMEVAFRILSWTWFFHVFNGSAAWSEPCFRGSFLRALYLHGDFTARYLERSDVNGNHYTANAAGLVFAGLFFGQGHEPQRWHRRGWEILIKELPRQVYPDGVDFEASTAYHRLVTELFVLPALYRERVGLGVPDTYRARVTAMGEYSSVYARPDGTVPFWGDADDGRALPLGDQPLNDHRYLAGLIGAAWNVPKLRETFSGPRSEIFWLLGAEAAASLVDSTASPSSRAFPAAGVYIMRTERDHVFIDCGSIGLAGRGGHGHNDCLSFEAMLDGVHLITDCGSYVYTASPKWRNRFRSTEFHNTPRIDGEEQNRFIRPDWLWRLHNDALPELLRWHASQAFDVFEGRHSGYERLRPPVIPLRTIVLDRARHGFVIRDEFEGSGEHEVRVPFHLSPGVRVEQAASGIVRLAADGRGFLFVWEDSYWELERRVAWVSPSYGLKHETLCLELVGRGRLQPLIAAVLPEGGGEEPIRWAAALLEAISKS